MSEAVLYMFCSDTTQAGTSARLLLAKEESPLMVTQLTEWQIVKRLVYVGYQWVYCYSVLLVEQIFFHLQRQLPADLFLVCTHLRNKVTVSGYVLALE